MDKNTGSEFKQSDVYRNDQRVPVGWFPIVISLLSFIPLLGVLVGFVCVIYGLTSKKRNARAISGVGVLGICFTITLYSFLFRSARSPKGKFALLHRQLLEQQILPTLIKSIEYYKIQHGQYPRSLTEMSIDIGLQIKLQDSQKMNSDGKYYYELDSTHEKYIFVSNWPRPKTIYV